MDVLIDFSNPDASLDAVAAAVALGKPCVIGTTGFSTVQETRLNELSSKVPIVKSANFSLGVNVLLSLCRKAAEKLGPSYDVEIVEAHHRNKNDAPSGTALMIGRVIAQVRNVTFQDVAKHGRTGNTGPRGGSEIGLHAIRGGDIFGEHTILFASEGERLELGHRASNRACFADGALCASNWVIGKLPGLYSMSDVLQME